MYTNDSVLPVGCAVEVGGQLGQLLRHSDGTCEVAFVNGDCSSVARESVKPAAAPGCDVLVGPELQMDKLAEEVSLCLFSKGYCILKVCQDSSACDSALTFMQRLDEEGSLKRLPSEVEEGYLGFGGRGKVLWLDSVVQSEVDPTIRANDAFLSDLVFSILPYSSDVLGGIAAHRTPALLSLWLRDLEFAEYPNPFPDDKILSTFLNTFDRTLLKAAHFMGPSPTLIKLTCRESQDLPEPPDTVKFEARRNTILLYRPRYVDLHVDVTNRDKDDTLTIYTSFMKADHRPEVVGRWDSAEALNLMAKIGSPAGSLEKASVECLATRLAANMDDYEFYRAALTGGCDTATEFQKERGEWELYYWPDSETALPWHIVGRHMGYCEGLNLFDNKYFNIAHNEATGMDPMQRHLLETGAMNLYQMGITKKHADRNPHHAGCSVGLDKDDWTLIETMLPDELRIGSTPNVQAIISNRFSFVFNLKGINYVADTACSASLCATHMANKMMQDRKNDALEFFVCMGLHECLNLMNFMGSHIGHTITTNGRCATFNQTADGYMRGDGCSGLVLKWASETEHRYGLWRGSAAGQNGRSATLTAPNGLAQEDVIWKGIRDAGILPNESSIWSCHGTGTSLGDPIEVGAMRKVQAKHDREFCLMVGTNKPCTGHLEGGAAMTSLVSVVMQLRQQKANPLIHLDVLNPHLEGTYFDGWFGTELSSTNLKQTHGHVSSFGFGGTNGHVVFHGEDQYSGNDPRKTFMKRLVYMSLPEVRPFGKDPDQWESDGLERATNPGNLYSVTITTEDERDKPAKYVLERQGLGEDFDLNNTSYSIVGDFNGSEPCRLEEGDVPGLLSIVVQIPTSGEIEFNFVRTLEPEMVLAPKKATRCRKPSAKISGPAEGLENTWLIVGEPRRDVRIDLFNSRGMMALNWVVFDEIVMRDWTETSRIPDGGEE